MRTGEVHGLKWKYLDFDLRIIRVRETFVLGEDEYTKTDGSQRDIQMSQPVFDALQAQYKVTGAASEYVFCNLLGTPLDNKNFSDRIWYPLLRHLGMEKRRPYQMRHTAATLWLASGEAPEWIARQLGHTSTEMLFRVYSRYVPNLTRQDGSAMERLLASRLGTGSVVLLNDKSIPDATNTDEAGKIKFHQSTGNLPLADAEQGVYPKPVYVLANQAQRTKTSQLIEHHVKRTVKALDSFPQASASNQSLCRSGNRNNKATSKPQASSGSLPQPPPTCRDRTRDRLPTQLI